MDQLAVAQAYSRLRALKANVPGAQVHTKYVTEFHEVLDILERVSGTSLADFRVPASEIRPIVTSVSYLGKGATYSKEPYCERSFFDMKVDGVLTLFELLTNSEPESKGPIGFDPRRK